MKDELMNHITREQYKDFKKLGYSDEYIMDIIEVSIEHCNICDYAKGEITKEKLDRLMNEDFKSWTYEDRADLFS